MIKYVVPDVERTFGVLEFGGEENCAFSRVNGVRRLVSRSYNLFSSVQRADNIIVVIPASAGEKNYEFEERVKLVNPKIAPEGYAINGRGYTNYIISADDIIKED